MARPGGCRIVEVGPVTQFSVPSFSAIRTNDHHLRGGFLRLFLRFSRCYLKRFVLAGFGILVGVTADVAAQQYDQSPAVIRGADQSAVVMPDVLDSDLRVLAGAKLWKPGDPIVEKPSRISRPPTSEQGIVPPSGRDPLVDTQGLGTAAIPAPILNFEGISFTGVVPPDTVGAVGPNHYIQSVNGPGSSRFVIFDKAGNIVVGPLEMSSLWAGGACKSGAGDPIVLYDRLADRWLLSEFAGVGNHLCVSISKTPDPVSGGWFNYDFPVPQFPDYPKYAVWPDAYYVSTNESSPAAYALDRTKMLAGLPATSQRFTAPSLTFGFNALLPATVDSAAPPPAPAGPGVFLRHRDDEIHNPGANNPTQDFLEAWLFDVDWANAANSTFTGPVNIPVAEFDSHLCGVGSFTCVPQPGTPQRLDPISEVVMWHLAYRNFGTHEAMVGNFVVDVNGTDRAGIRWFELRRTGGGPWTIFQEGTHSPDATNRWVGSPAIDKDGNIALGYSVSSSSVFPGIRYSGRLASDPPGQMQSEAVLFNGTGSQSSNRIGDYSAMTIDPADDCTFWYTNEYIPSNGQWRTRIGTFVLPSCAPSGNQPPVAEANGPYSGTPGVPISFSSAGSVDPDGSIVSYMWNFGDGSAPSNEPNPTHAYSAAGTFTATLTVTDNQGVADTDTAMVTVSGGGGNQLPVAEANGPYSGPAGGRGVAFSSAGSFDPDGTIVSYSWNFGDGSAPSNQPNPRHIYSAAGTYTAVLTVTDNQGGTDTDTAVVTISGGGGGNQPPVAEANGPYSGIVGGRGIAFSSAGSFDPNGMIVGYSWNFGDGSQPSSQANPRHVYNAPGNYTATLTVTDNQGATGSDTASVTVK